MHDFFAHFVWKMYKTVTKFNYEIFIHFVSWKGEECYAASLLAEFKPLKSQALITVALH